MVVDLSIFGKERPTVCIGCDCRDDGVFCVACLKLMLTDGNSKFSDDIIPLSSLPELPTSGHFLQ